MNIHSDEYTEQKFFLSTKKSIRQTRGIVVDARRAGENIYDLHEKEYWHIMADHDFPAKHSTGRTYVQSQLTKSPHRGAKFIDIFLDQTGSCHVRIPHRATVPHDRFKFTVVQKMIYKGHTQAVIGNDIRKDRANLCPISLHVQRKYDKGPILHAYGFQALAGVYIIRNNIKQLLARGWFDKDKNRSGYVVPSNTPPSKASYGWYSACVRIEISWFMNCMDELQKQWCKVGMLAPGVYKHWKYQMFDGEKGPKEFRNQRFQNYPSTDYTKLVSWESIQRDYPQLTVYGYKVNK